MKDGLDMADLQQGGGREEGVRGTEKGTIGRVRYRAVTWFGWAALGAGVGAGAGPHIMELICDCMAGLAIAASICFIWAAI
jgi:hypothetical protein